MTNRLSPSEVAALGSGFVVDSFEQLWIAIGRLPFFSSDRKYAWRGVSDFSHRTRSTLYRYVADDAGDVVNEAKLRAAEVEILNAAREWGLGGTGSTAVTDLQLLANLQHHGVPTRLLDVTANPLTALWFACSADDDVHADGMLIAFDVKDYPVVLTDGGDTMNLAGRRDDPLGFDLTNAVARSADQRLPFVVKPSYLDPRMSAQEGFFISSACPDPGALEEYREVPRTAVDGLFLGTSWHIPQDAAHSLLFEPKPIAELQNHKQALWCFVIPAGMKQDILHVLASSFDRTAAKLFPDYAGFRHLGVPEIGARRVKKRNESEGAAGDAAACGAVNQVITTTDA